MDLSYDVTMTEMDVCDKRPKHGDLNVNGARLLVPGDSSKSLIGLRIGTTNKSVRMPPLATVRVHSLGLNLVNRWIDGLNGCR